MSAKAGAAMKSAKCVSASRGTLCLCDSFCRCSATGAYAVASFDFILCAQRARDATSEKKKKKKKQKRKKNAVALVAAARACSILPLL